MTKRELREALVAMVDRCLDETCDAEHGEENVDIFLNAEYVDLADFLNRL